MMPYSSKFAAVYDRMWKGFSESLAPELEAILRTHVEEHNLDLRLADLCCGTGQLVAHFAAAGWNAVGVDQSEAMLSFAFENNSDYVESGAVGFVESPVEEWTPDSEYSCITCLFDSMNHLPDLATIAAVMGIAHKALADPGLLVFDVNTRKGFSRWNTASFTDDGDTVLFNRGLYSDGMSHAVTKITGFTRRRDDTYERFDDTVAEVVVGMDEVETCLRDTGFGGIRVTSTKELTGTCDDPESLSRAFFFAAKTSA